MIAELLLVYWPQKFRDHANSGHGRVPMARSLPPLPRIALYAQCAGVPVAGVVVTSSSGTSMARLVTGSQSHSESPAVPKDSTGRSMGSGALYTGIVLVTGRDSGRLDGLELHAGRWAVERAEVHAVRSSFFEDARLFPPGSATLDCALLMRDIPVTWTAVKPAFPALGDHLAPAGDQLRNSTVSWLHPS